VLKIPQGSAFRHGDGWAVFRVASGKAGLTRPDRAPRETEVDALNLLPRKSRAPRVSGG
jgi:hypothetical protein